MNSTNDIRAIKGLVPVPYSYWWLWGGLAVVVLAAGIGLWLWKRRQPTTVPETVAPLSAGELALAALAQLHAENPAVELFYTRLADIVRRYLEGQFGLHAPDRTTEEFLSEVSRSGALLSAHWNRLAAFLQEADLVKFARFRPGQDGVGRAFAAAEKFVRESALAGGSESPVAAQLGPGRGRQAAPTKTALTTSSPP